MLLLHGVGHRWQMWTPLIESLARDFDVITVDLPGFGLAPPLPDAPSIKALTDALEALLDELGITRVHLVGNSLGGWLSLELALRKRALSVCALAPAGLWNRPEDVERRLRFAFKIWVGASRRLSWLAPLLRLRSVRAVALSGLFGRPWRIPPEIAIGDFRNMAVCAIDEVFAAVEESSFSGGASIIEPVTVAWCDRDPLFNAKRCPGKELPRQAQIVRLHGCGHVPTWDDPSLVLETIRATVARAGD